MPITYSIDKQKRVIFETWIGDIAATDLADHWQPYLADPAVLAIRRTVVDLRGCTILFTEEELAGLVNGLVIPALEGRDWKTAIVVHHPAQFGVSRQYQALAESYSRDSIFSDPAMAISWLVADQGRPYASKAKL